MQDLQCMYVSIENLGQRFINGNPQQCRNLIRLLSSNSNLIGIVAPHFTPTPTQQSPAATEAFINCYKLITSMKISESDLAFVLLNKVGPFKTCFILFFCFITKSP